MRVVLDANVLVSAVISSRGSPGRILALWEEEMFDLVISPPILEELERVIRYPRIQRRYNLPDVYVERFLGMIAGMSIRVNPAQVLDDIERDPSDNRYLECAREGGATYIVTGDKDFLELKEYAGIVILPPAGFLVLLEGIKKDRS